MKTKGISVWEQYIEYAVLLIAIVVFIWFSWGAFGSKISVQLGQRTLTTSTIDDELLAAAKRLEPNLSENAPSPITIKQPEPLGDKFTRRLAQSISPNNHLVFPKIDRTAGIEVNQGMTTTLRRYTQPDIDAPRDVRTHQWFGTIKTSEIDRIEDLQSEVNGPPHDTSWVQVAAQFDIDEVIETFSNAIEDEDIFAIPSQWYDDGADIFDIVIERQTLQDDQWSSAEEVHVLPGHLSFRQKLADTSIDAMEREAIIRDLRGGKQGDVSNPDFYLLKGYVPQNMDTPSSWDGEETLIEEDGPRIELLSDIQRLEKQIRRKQDSITNIEKRIADERSGGGGRGGGGSPMGGGGSPGGGSSGGNSKLDRLRRQLDKANQDLVELFDEHAEMMVELQAMEEEEPVGTEITMSGDIWVWGHDMSVEEGETYRYRMTIQLANPFFGHKPSLYPDQKLLAEKVTIASTVSAWSDAIVVQHSMQWFVLGAKNSIDSFEGSRISADLFEFSDGKWQLNSIGVNVGQRLGQPKPDGITTDWFVLDVLEDTTGDAILLQHIDSGEIQLLRPQGNSKDYKDLVHQVRTQIADVPVEDDASPTDPSPQPLGGGGGGGGTPF